MLMATRLKSPILRNYDLSPDGVQITVDWETMYIGTSMFIPCVNTEKAKEQVKELFKERGWQYLVKIRIEDGRLGIRAWRML